MHGRTTFYNHQLLTPSAMFHSAGYPASSYSYAGPSKARFTASYTPRYPLAAPTKPTAYASTSSAPYRAAPCSSTPPPKPACTSTDPLLHLILTAPSPLILPSGPTLRLPPLTPSQPYISIHPRSRTCIDIVFSAAWPDARRVVARVMRGDWEERRCGVREVREAAVKAYARCGCASGEGWEVWEVVRQAEGQQEEEENVEDDDDDDSGESTVSWFSSESDSSV